MEFRVASRFGFLGLVLVAACTATTAGVLDPAQVAREYRQRSWQHEHGLPAGDRVFAILQTRDGYLWVGTQYGLARFDGRNFMVFDHVNTPELESDDCRTLAEDAEGNLWIGTAASLIRRSGSEFAAFSGKLGAHFAAYPALGASRSGGVWVGGRGGVLQIQGEHVRTYHSEEFLPLTVGLVTCLEEDEAGFLWIGTLQGCLRLDTTRERFERVGRGSPFENLPVYDTWGAPNGDRWFITSDFVPQADGPIPNVSLACLARGRWPEAPESRHCWAGARWPRHFLTGDRDGTLWLPGGVGQLQRYRDGRLEVLPMSPESRGNYALSACIDREGNLWAGTEASGLQCWVPNKVTAFTTAEGLAHDNVWSICEARDGSVWVGTDGGVTRLKGGHGTTMKRQDGTVHQDVRAVAEDLEGAIWVGTMRSLECIRDGVSHQVDLPGEWFEAKIRALHPGRDGSMWIGTVRGLTRFHKGELRKFAGKDGLLSNEVRAIVEARSGHLWVGTLGGGLCRLQEGRFTTLTKTNGLSSNNVWALLEDPGGVLWIGTDNGLNCLKDGKITCFSKANGLPDTLVNCILADDYGRLWIGHDRGVYALDRQQLLEVAEKQRSSVDAVSYNESDGLLSLETNGQKSNPSACKTRDGRLWFPTTRGIATIDPAKVRRYEVAPLPAIEQVRANGRQVFAQHRQASSSTVSGKGARARATGLILPPGGAHVLEFLYTANTFVAPEKARFKYRLVGLDDNWIDAGTRRETYFTSLRPRDYRFELIASDHRGLWQEQCASVSFYLAPFFYQTWWFYGSCWAGVALLAWLAVRWRMRESQRISELERTNALNEQRRQIARDIHDELGSNLTHIMQLSDQLRGSATLAGRSLPAERIAAIAGEAVDNIGDIVWANNPEYDTLEDLVAYLREHAASFFANTGMAVHLHFPETVPDCAVTGWFRRHLVLLLKEALLNVSKHADARQVSVRLSLSEGQIQLFVADDGKGFLEEETRRFASGLANMRQRANELKGALVINSQPGKGTQLSMTVPIQEPFRKPKRL